MGSNAGTISATTGGGGATARSALKVQNEQCGASRRSGECVVPSPTATRIMQFAVQIPVISPADTGLAFAISGHSALSVIAKIASQLTRRLRGRLRVRDENMAHI